MRPKLTPCPVCHTPAVEDPVTLQGELTPPRIGDLGICPDCGTVVVYGAEGFTVATETDIRGADDPALLARFLTWLATNRNGGTP